MSVFLLMTFLPSTGAEGPHSDQGKEAESSPRPAGEERQLRELLLQL